MLLLLLAACGSGEGEGTRFDALNLEAQALGNEVGALSYTDPATLSTTGTASYSGVMQLGLAAIPGDTLDDTDLAGDLELTVNFAGTGDPVTGSATRFVDRDDTLYEGTLIIGGGELDRAADPEAEYTLGADLGGDLTSPEGTTYEVDADFLGDFAGEDPDYAFGTVVGQTCTDGVCGALDGGWVAAR